MGGAGSAAGPGWCAGHGSPGREVRAGAVHRVGGAGQGNTIRPITRRAGSVGNRPGREPCGPRHACASSATSHVHLSCRRHLADPEPPLGGESLHLKRFAVLRIHPDMGGAVFPQAAGFDIKSRRSMLGHCGALSSAPVGLVTPCGIEGELTPARGVCKGAASPTSSPVRCAPAAVLRMRPPGVPLHPPLYRRRLKSPSREGCHNPTS